MGQSSGLCEGWVEEFVVILGNNSSICPISKVTSSFMPLREPFLSLVNPL